MADVHEHPWLEALSQQAGIRRALLLHGDVFDISFNAKLREYQPTMQVILHSLEQRGFSKVVVWDPFSGIENVNRWDWDSMAQEAVQLEGAQGASGYSDYDMGPMAAMQPVAGSGQVSAEDFFSVVYYHLMHQKKERIAFVVDWSQYLFGNANALSVEERRWLMILAKAIRNVPVSTTIEDVERPSNLVVLVSQRLGAIPPVFYQDNASVREVIITSPSRNERELYLKRTFDQWRLRSTPQPGEPAFHDFVDALEGLALLDLQQLIKLSHQTYGESLTYEKLINLYKYGEKKSRWEDLSRAKLASMEQTLKKRVKGQDDAVQKVSKVIIRAFTGLSGLQHSKKQKMPKGILFFVGPTGVGKTELAKALAQFLFGDEDACIRFDMSEFNHDHSDQRLVGAPPGYVGYEEGGQLTNAVKKRPFSVLLFDEIEKAHVRILDKFLQILEDGRLTDGKGETVSFSETVIIFTSNIGAAEIQLNDNLDEVRAQFMAKVRDHFILVAKRPELLNRIGDNIVPFNFIQSDGFLTAIAKAKLEPLRERLKEKYRIEAFRFENEEAAFAAIASGVDKRMGGRGVLNEIVTRIIDPLAEFLFKGQEDSNAYAGRTVVARQIADSGQFRFELE